MNSEETWSFNLLLWDFVMLVHRLINIINKPLLSVNDLPVPGVIRCRVIMSYFTGVHYCVIFY